MEAGKPVSEGGWHAGAMMMKRRSMTLGIQASAFSLRLRLLRSMPRQGAASHALGAGSQCVASARIGGAEFPPVVAPKLGRVQRHSEEQIITAHKEVQARAKVDDVCRRQGISQPTYYKLKRRFGGLEVSDAKRLRFPEEENRRLKKVVAAQVTGGRTVRTAQAVLRRMSWTVAPAV